MQQTASKPNANQTPPSILKSLALAVGTLTLSTWALGTLWMHAEADQAATTSVRTVSPDVVASASP